MFKAIIFDLDGVIVDTAKYHYLAWKRLAQELDIEFSEKDNEKLKGVSRMRSLDIILEIGNQELSTEEKNVLAEKKNKWYLEYLSQIDESEILPGINNLLKRLCLCEMKIALGSASKNAKHILDKLGLTKHFDVIVDGLSVSAAKPDPEVFTRGADALGIENEFCIVVEDSAAGIEAANEVGMYSIGIGNEEALMAAKLILPNTEKLSYELISNLNNNQ